jgi:hypothetical protein
MWTAAFISSLLAAAPAARPAPAASPVAPVVQAALERALAVPEARVEDAVLAAGGAGACQATEADVPRAIEGSGRVAVRVAGRGPRGGGCGAWLWVDLRVVAPVAVATRALRAGEPLAGATVTEQRELRAGHAPARLDDGLVAARAIAAGQVIEADAASVPTARPGDTVKVVVVAGALTVEQPGRAVPCARGRSCAVLRSGRHVEGDLIDGRLVVEAP